MKITLKDLEGRWSYAITRWIIAIIFSLVMTIWALQLYIRQSMTNWEQTSGLLNEVSLYNRIRNKNEELFLKIIYHYRVKNQSFLISQEEIVASEQEGLERKNQIEEAKKSIVVFYNVDNPTESTLNKLKVGPDINILFVIIPTMLIAGILSYSILLATIKFSRKYR